MARRKAQDKNELVKCPFCGERYAVTYKHCPFCNEDGTGGWDDEPQEDQVPQDEEQFDDNDDEGGSAVSSGRRLSGGGHTGRKFPIGRILWGVLSVALIVTAVGIVISIVKPDLLKKVASGTPAPTTTVTAAPTPAAQPSQQPVQQEPDPNPIETETTQPQPTQEVTVAPVSSGVAPTAFSLNRQDFTFSSPGEIFDMKVKFTPADATAEVTWKSSNPNVAAVSWNGRVTAVSRGTVTLTASVAGLGEKTCIVRCSFSGSVPAPSDSTTTPPATTTTAPKEVSSSGSVSLSRSDFTLKPGESWKLKVTGSSSTPVWKTSNAAVATVTPDGTVTYVGKGSCKVTATVDGVTLTCIVRCSG